MKFLVMIHPIQNRKSMIVQTINSFLLISLLLLFANESVAQVQLMSFSKLAEKCEKGNIKACNKLYNYARNNRLPSNRIEAIKYIENQNVLIEIIENDLRPDVCEAATHKISDQNDLIDIALNSRFSHSRIAAISRINNQDVLNKIATNADTPDEIIAAINRIEDKDILASIVVSEDHIGVQEAVVHKITDQDLLIKIASEEPRRYHRSVRRAAMQKITDQDALMNIFLSDNFDMDREASLDYITDQQVLIDQLNNEDIYDKSPIIKRLSDSILIVKIALNDDHLYGQNERETAVKKITDQDILLEIAKTDLNPWVRLTAVDKIINQAKLGQLAVTENHEVVFKKIVEKINDESIRNYVAKEQKDIVFSLRYLFNELDAEKYYQELSAIKIRRARYGLPANEVLNDRRRAELKLTACDSILKKYYDPLIIRLDVHVSFQQYYSNIGQEAGRWYSTSQFVTIQMNDSIRTISYPGLTGSSIESSESLSRYGSSSEDLPSFIEVYEALLSSIGQDGLIEISQHSEIRPLRRAAERILTEKFK